MTYTFVKDITREMIDETLSSFFEENDICDLSRQKILKRVVSDAFDLDGWDEAETLVGALDERLNGNTISGHAIAQEPQGIPNPFGLTRFMYRSKNIVIGKSTAVLNTANILITAIVNIYKTFNLDLPHLKTAFLPF